LGCALAVLGGCVYKQQGLPEVHFKEFSAKPPQGNTVTVCHAYGCKAQTSFTFSQSDIGEISSLMQRVRRMTAREENGESSPMRLAGWNGAWCQRSAQRASPSGSEKK